MAQRPNVFDAAVSLDPSDPPGYRGAAANLGVLSGGAELNVKLYELAPGEALCPYHYETVEEWLLLLDGELELRTPDGHEPLARGALVCFAAGPGGAHKVRTPGDAAGPARLLMFSSSREPVVAVYPDSDKVGVWIGDGEQGLLVRRADAHVDYYEGESHPDPGA